MLNPDFDPYDVMQQLAQGINQLNENILQLDRNLHGAIRAHQALAQRVTEQGQVIDVLIKGLESQNTANELLIKELAANIMKQVEAANNI